MGFILFEFIIPVMTLFVPVLALWRIAKRSGHPRLSKSILWIGVSIGVVVAICLAVFGIVGNPCLGTTGTLLCFFVTGLPSLLLAAAYVLIFAGLFILAIKPWPEFD